MNIRELMDEIRLLWPNAFGDTGGVSAWTAQYERALGRHEGPGLETAFNACVAVRSSRSGWPKPGDILEHLPLDPARHRHAEASAGERWADTLLFSRDIGQRARQEGWARGLVCWAESNPGKVPGEAAIQRFRDDAAHMVEVTAKLRRGEPLAIRGLRVEPDTLAYRHATATALGMEQFQDRLERGQRVSDMERR